MAATCWTVQHDRPHGPIEHVEGPRAEVIPMASQTGTRATGRVLRPWRHHLLLRRSDTAVEPTAKIKIGPAFAKTLGMGVNDTDLSLAALVLESRRLIRDSRELLRRQTGTSPPDEVVIRRTTEVLIVARGVLHRLGEAEEP
jgi:hypothetical protein